MVIDTSVVLAILQQEPEAEQFTSALQAARECLISAVSVLEAGIVVTSRRTASAEFHVDEFFNLTDLTVVPFDAEQARIARLAYARFGKRRHRAGLNFGDCAAYALAKSLGSPLLFKGGQFALTDLPVLANR